MQKHIDKLSEICIMENVRRVSEWQDQKDFQKN